MAGGKREVETTGRRVSLIRKQAGKQQRRQLLPTGCRPECSIREALGGLSLIQQRVFLAQLGREARAEPPRAMGSPSSLHSPNVTGAKPLALALGKLRGARHKLLPVSLSSPPTARALTDDQGLFPKRHNFHLLLSSFHTAQSTSSVLV